MTYSQLNLDSQWSRISEEFDSDGNRIVPIFARHARTQGGMIIGRIVRGAAVAATSVFTAQRWRYGQFTNVGEFASVEQALEVLEALP